jgi:exodeoxyribonuclease-5
MNYKLSKLEEVYKVKLDDTQKQVLSDLTNFVESGEQEICLSARAGTGKSLILSMLYDIVEDNGYTCAFVAPTNKAKLVVTDRGNQLRNSLTLHSLLNLRPNIEIMEFDASQLSFNFGCSKSQPYYDILLIDECSMINDDLYNVLKKKCKESKLIFSGDRSQLAPVKQRHISKIFNLRTLVLTKIHRQPEGKLYKILEYLRKKPLYHFENVSDENGSVIICNNIFSMINQYSYLFKISKDFNDQNLVKMITYTNNRISALNQIIRKSLYSDDQEYHIGEVLTGYDTCNYISDICINNSRDYVVENICPTVISFGTIKLNGYYLMLKDNTGISFQIAILSRNNAEFLFAKLAEYLETKRQKAVHTKSSKDWSSFFKFYNSFLTPVDLLFEGRVIKRKSLDYGYCMSAYKSQSSTYSIVLIDMENIWRCQDKEELRQMQYVACSRTKSDLIIYQKDGNGLTKRNNNG